LAFENANKKEYVESMRSQAKNGRGCPSPTLRGDEPNALLGGFFPLFSFLERFRSLSQSLAGDELNEPKNDQLSTLWEDSVSRSLERDAFETGNSQVSSMWLPESVESRYATNASRKAAALHVPRLWLSILKAVNPKTHTPLFFCN
jgi:hypothetical protein